LGRQRRLPPGEYSNPESDAAARRGRIARRYLLAERVA
jgi:hypothetical protein